MAEAETERGKCIYVTAELAQSNPQRIHVRFLRKLGFAFNKQAIATHQVEKAHLARF